MKKYVSFLLSVLVMLSVIAAATVNVSALSVTTGESDDYKYKVYDGKYAELTEYISGKQNGDTYTIPSEIGGYTVKYLGDELFSENDVPAKKVIIPGTVTEIGDSAFFHSDGLEGVEYSALEEIVIPSGVTDIGDSAFWHCEKLKSVELPGTLRRLGESAFSDCTKLKKVIINEGLDTIPALAFEGCTSLENVSDLSFVNSIGKYAFLNCPKLKSLSVGEFASLGKYSCGYIEKTPVKTVLNKNFKLNITSANKFYKSGTECYVPYKASTVYGISCNYLVKSKAHSEMRFQSGVSFKLKVDGKSATKWKSSDPKVVKVTSSGKVTALTKGTVTLSATLADGTKYSRQMRVLRNPSLDKKEVSVKKGKTVKVAIRGKVFSKNNAYSNTKIAKITSKKSADKITVKGLKKGKATLKIKVNGRVLKLKVKVI
ncbi:MAG: leucine-rich repeat protein [Ruminococcus sp.]|nr:leucine-rich repeat protein [Ruminococcus sp.]